MDPFLILHAARAYGVPPALVIKVLTVQSPFPIPGPFLEGCRFTTGNPNTAEHNAYLVARWVASLKAAGKSDTQILDTLCTTGAVSWKRPWWLRLGRWAKAQYAKLVAWRI